MSKEMFPRAKIVLSTWIFDYDGPGEYDGVWKAFSKRPDWVDYLMVEAREKFPRYVLDHGSAGGLPILTFPEISMYRMRPWGGFGANPLPGYLQTTWDRMHPLVAGGFPYSEGIFEDINKAIYLQLYWNPKQSALKTVHDYATYEFAPEVADDVVRIVQRLETHHHHDIFRENVLQQDENLPWYNLPNLKQPTACLQRMKRAAKRLPTSIRTSWRWRLLEIRVALDAELKRSDGRPTKTSDRLFRELAAIYRTPDASEVCPPHKRKLQTLLKDSMIRKAPHLSDCVATWQLSTLHAKRGTVAKAPYVGPRHRAQWRTFTKKGYPFVNLHDGLGNADGIVYLANDFDIPSDGRWTFIMGYDGGIKVFVDGKSVFCDPKRVNPATPERSRIPVKLPAGRHEIVIAFDTDSGNGWGIFFRFERPKSARSPAMPQWRK
jgi:hypothetical protein